MVRDGYFYGLGFIAAAVLVFLVTGNWVWAIAPVLLACFFFWFFRDPKRPVPVEAGLVVSPADGKITEVARIQTPGGERIRLSIFLSVFDVHVNRSPIALSLIHIWQSQNFRVFNGNLPIWPPNLTPRGCLRCAQP